MERNIGFVASMLSTLMARATYVPIDPSFPPDRQTHILEHSNSELGLTLTLILTLTLTLILTITLTLSAYIFL